MANWLSKLSDALWGFPLIVTLFLVGLYFTVKLHFIQIKFLPKSFRYMFETKEGADGDITGFGALCTELAATLGTGNIVGVAAALGLGGAGSLFWMVITAFFMMAIKYAESFLAVKFRTQKNGSFLGGPFYYIEKGMGKSFKPLAKAFALFGSLAGVLGMGTVTQIKSVTSAVQGFFDPNIKAVAFNLGGQKYSVFTVICAVVFTILTFFVLVGGLKRIARVSELFIPLMAGIYIFFCLVIILTNFEKLGDALCLILKDAFNFKSAAGGFFIALKVGMSRGIFTNEAGLGTAPIAAASAKTDSSFKQGVVSMSGTFIDTVIMCPLTGLAIILSGTNFRGDPENVMAQTFKNGVNFLSDRIMEGVLTVCLVFFAFSTIIGWNFFALSCFRYFTNGKGVKAYNAFYIFAVFLGAFLPFSAVLKLADIFNALMLLPNLIALIFLRKTIINETKLSLNES